MRDTLSDITSPVTFLSLIITPVFFFKCCRDKVSGRRMVSKNLRDEMSDTLHAMDHTRHPENFVMVRFPDGKTFQHMSRSLNLDVYDNLIFAGRINFLRYSLQQQIQGMFRRIKERNRHVAEVGKMIALNQADQTYGLCEGLQEIEKRLLDEMPCTMRRLERDT